MIYNWMKLLECYNRGSDSWVGKHMFNISISFTISITISISISFTISISITITLTITLSTLQVHYPKLN
jgi:hypothetical protein